MNAFFYGMVLAFGLIIPLGIQNIFILNLGATHKKWVYTLPGVLTAFFCDSVLIISAVLGVSMIVLSLPGVKNAIYYSGLVFLVYMGWVTWRSTQQPECAYKPLLPRQQVYFSASASLLNPHAIIDSVTVLGSNSLHFIGIDKWFYTSACLLVALCWFMGLSKLGGMLGHMSSNYSVLKWLNKFSALTIWAVALYILHHILFD